MSFQDVPSGGRPSSSSSSIASKSPSQAVAAGIFQINTAVAAFCRLVDAIGTAKDTTDHRQKLSLFLIFSYILTAALSPVMDRIASVTSVNAFDITIRQDAILLDNEIAFNEAMIEEREQGIREVGEQIGQMTFHQSVDSSSAATTQARVQLSKASKSGKSRASWVCSKLLTSRVLLDMECEIFLVEILLRNYNVRKIFSTFRSMYCMLALKIELRIAAYKSLVNAHDIRHTDRRARQGA
ncbi:hypothetical protein CRYUN_Cryun24cG0132100 [Craigia yunnanensis]